MKNILIMAVAGIGNIWVDREDLKFRTDYGLTYTRQEEVAAMAGVDDTFAGIRITSKYERTFGKMTTYSNDTVVDENLDETSDLRVNMINSVSVTMNSRLALKVSLQWLYDTEPSFEAIDRFLVFPPAGTPSGQVPRQLDNLDTIFTPSLVINF